MANGVRVRRDVAKLAVWDDTLLWYARAVADLRTRAFDDPTSWRYQAAIHDFDKDADPLAAEGGTPPSGPERTKYWSKCQHGSWFFLPWHRMYLLCFEQIVAAAIVKLGGPAGWALPFWDYSDATNPNARRIPEAFRQATLPDGSPNALRVTARRPGANNGVVIAGPQGVNVSDALDEPLYTGVIGGSPGFGGVSAGGVAGMLEVTPHGSMHVAVGGDVDPVGWMSQFNTAALDPIFWLHHANIDRLWAVWRTQTPVRLDPTAKSWLNKSFDFHGADGGPVQFTCSQVVNTEAPLLNYRYEGVGAPKPPPAVETIALEAPVPEMVGATAKPIVLQGKRQETSVAVRLPAGPRRGATEALAKAADVWISVENITGQGGPSSYAVFLNLPEGADPRNSLDHLVGVVPMFGVKEATRPDGPHAGSGLSYALNAGKVVQRLQGRPGWNPAELRIAFVPWREDEGPRPAVEALPAAIQIGRVSVNLG